MNLNFKKGGVWFGDLSFKFMAKAFKKLLRAILKGVKDF